MSDLSRYVGIPFVPGGYSFAGADCWGTVQLYYRNELGIELPRPEGFPTATQRWRLAMDLHAGMGLEIVPAVANEYQAGDILLLQHGAIPDNFAVVVGGGRYLNTSAQTGSTITSVVTDRVWAVFRRRAVAA